VKDIARELIALYAKRMQQKGYAFDPDGEWQYDFERHFEYEETEDQLRCAEEIKSDMEREVPMDRLLCGDVGFGKTEVALRAAFKCVTQSKQCVVLVPTTSEILWGVIDGSLLSTVWNRITSSSGSLLSIGLKQLANITGQPMSTILNFVGGGATYICYVNGSQASFSTSIKYPVLAGGLAVRQNVNGTVKAMIQLMPMKIDKVGAASVMSNGTRYETADDMQVYLWYKGQYYATKLSEVNSEGYYLTGWYDNFGCAAGKRVRVIVAVKKD